MNYLTEKKFSFESKAVSADTFGVVEFVGTEGLSQLYQFDITLVSERADIDLDMIMQEPASFYIFRPDGSKVPFHGIINQCDLERAIGGYYLYRVVLVPKLWWLTLTHHNQIFLNLQPREIITQVLKDGGLTALDFEFRLQGDYVTWEYACQFGESHYDFVCRWMERNGLYYFFDQSGETEKLIMTDSKMAHVPSNLGNELSYAPVSGLEALHLDESVQSYICRRRLVPQKITMRDYDYRKPSLNVEGKADVANNGHGEQYYYGDHFRTPEEGNKLAKIRSEEFLCKQKQFHGESTVPYLMPGYTFTLKKHFNEQLNTEYLNLSMEHRGNQTGYLISGIRENLAEREAQRVYANTFTAIESGVQFRAARTTNRPNFHGSINGRIDAAGSGQYAELDDQGRYKVILPFDLSGREDGMASAWVRMMQPYGGSDHGLHFPLHKGCEVLLTFIGGDPDRPLIAGTVANPDNPSQVTSDTATMAKLTTSGGNLIHIEDREGNQRMLMQSPTSNTWMRMGAPNDPPNAFADSDQDPELESTPESSEAPEQEAESEPGPVNSRQKPVEHNEDGFAFSTGGSANYYIGANYKAEIGGFANSIIIGGENNLILGEEVKVVLGAVYTLEAPSSFNFSPVHKKIHAMDTKITTNTTDITANKTSVDGTLTKLSGETTKLAGEVRSLAGEATKITGEITKLAGNTSALAANQDKIIGEINWVSALSKEIATSQTSIIAEKSSFIVDQLEAIGASTQTIQEKIVIAESEDTIVGFKVTI